MTNRCGSTSSRMRYAVEHAEALRRFAASWPAMSLQVRNDLIWRHRRGESAVVDMAAAHVQAMHAMLDAIPLQLNSLPQRCHKTRGSAAPLSTWALTTAEDLQFACYTGGGFYRRHSDAQNATRRRLTAVYYPDTRAAANA